MLTMCRKKVQELVSVEVILTRQLQSQKEPFMFTLSKHNVIDVTFIFWDIFKI